MELDPMIEAYGRDERKAYMRALGGMVVPVQVAAYSAAEAADLTEEQTEQVKRYMGDFMNKSYFDARDALGL